MLCLLFRLFPLMRYSDAFYIFSSGACVKERYAIGGSGSSYIYGYCDANFREGMTRQEAIDFVTKGAAHEILASILFSAILI